MKFVFLLAFIVACFGIIEGASESRLEQLDIDNVLSNHRILNNYIKCLLSKGPCTAEGRELKDRIPKALETACKDCSDKEKKLVRRAGKHLQEHNPKDFDNIIMHFDPTGERKQQVINFIAATD